MRRKASSTLAPSRVRSSAPADPGVRRVAGAAISVEVATPERFAQIEAQWRDLTERAVAPNVFMEPAVVAAAAAADHVVIHVLLAWAEPTPGARARLVGSWALACRRPASRLPITVLKTPVHDHACLGIPVLDRELATDVLMQMLDTIADASQLPNFLQIASLDAAGPMAGIFEEVLARRGSAFTRLEPRRRPQLRREDSGAGPAILSASRAKALRQKHRRLAERGETTITLHCGRQAVAVLDEFIALEGAGWKRLGALHGHAIGRRAALEAFFRAAIDGLAAKGLATLTALRCDGRAAAMQLTVFSGSAAFTWKSAYDEHLRNCGPGIILLQDITAGFQSDARIRSVDSCNHRDDGYMAEFWSGRRSVVDMVLDVRRKPGALFRLLSLAESSRREAQALARHLRAKLLAAGHRAEGAWRAIQAGAGVRAR